MKRLTLGFLLFLAGCATAPHPVPASTSPHLLTTHVDFQNQTYYLCWADAALPADLKVAFTCPLKQDQPTLDGPVHTFLLRMAPGSPTAVLQAVEFSDTARLYLADLQGDGHQQLFTSAEALPPSLKAKPVPWSVSLTYSDGNDMARGSFGSQDTIVFKIDGEICVLLRQPPGGITTDSSIGIVGDKSLSVMWADLYATGRPVLCNISRSTRWPIADRSQKTYSRRLESHWSPDPATNTWHLTQDNRPIDPEGPWPDKLFGVLASPASSTHPAPSQP